MIELNYTVVAVHFMQQDHKMVESAHAQLITTEETSMTDHQTGLPSNAIVRTRAMPADTNPAGDIFGGWLLSQMDMAGEITASQKSRSRVVTVAVNAMTFHKPVHVGDVVSCYTHIERIGRTSISVRIEAIVMRLETGQKVPVTEGVFVYVALDADGNPTEVERDS